jgi:hypothetical protein
VSDFKLEMQEIANEKSRDYQLAVDAAGRIGAGEAIEHIETEALEALSGFLWPELQERERKGEHYTNDLPEPF